MNNLLSNSTRRIFCAVVLVALALPAHAAVTNVAWYRLGENDPGAASGLAVTNTTADIVGTKHLNPFGSPRYTNAVAAAAASRLGSSLAVNFNGTSQFLSNAVVSLATNNFGIEAWVKPNTTNAGTYFIANNGFAGSGGWGLYQSGGSYVAFYGSLIVFGNGTALPGTWTHVALVRDNGTGTLYVNGNASGTTTISPNPVTGGFAIGATPAAPQTAFFNGTIDEVRVFTFGAGQFSTNDLLINFQRVTTLPATGITPPNATLNGTANPIGLPTSAWFDWGTTTNYGNATPAQAVGSGSSSTNFSQVRSNLSGGLAYHFRAVVSNSLGIAYGTNQSFTTPVFTPAVTNLPGVWNGSVAWGDYDNDGRLDFLLTGGTSIINI